MLKFKRNRKQVPKYLKQNKVSSGNLPFPGKGTATEKYNSADLNTVQKNITRQVILAGLTVVLTIVILFAMTSAWYTNIVQTSGLVFEAEAWGFDGEIKVDPTPIKAAPGDSGFVNLEIQNKSQNISAVSLNVSKLEQDDEMGKRLFLYVDTHMDRDGELMDRVYLNSREGYTYTVFANGNLTLTEKISNAPQLKWQWVYDVLGYYVMAQCTDITDENGVTIQRTTVQEYLRPIEYDYDEATTIFSEDKQGLLTMELTTVDGTRSPEAFLRQLSLSDGYQGQIDTSKVTQDGYYPVDVDENGYGVYAYLCNYKEIQDATDYDTMLGGYASIPKEKRTSDQQALLDYTITLVISAQKNENTVVNVTRLDTLQQAIAENKADVIQINDDISIPKDYTLSIPKNTRVMLDLNGKTITCNSDRAIDALSGSSLTMINGKLKGPATDAKTYGVCTTGAEVVMSNVEISGFQYGVFMGDHAANNPMDSRVHMVNCNVTAKNYAVFINGNGEQSAQKTQLILEKTTLQSDGLVLTGSGNADRRGTDIQILDCKIIQTSEKPGTGIYHPQKDGTILIQKSEISGYTGIALKAGAMEIIDTKVTGTGIQTVEPAFDKSGFSDTADAVYVETGYGHMISLEIRGSSEFITNTNNKDSRSLRVYKAEDPNAIIRVYSGTFEEALPDAYIDKDSVRNGVTVTQKQTN